VSDRTKFQRLDRARAVSEFVAACKKLSACPEDTFCAAAAKRAFGYILAVEGRTSQSLHNGITTFVGEGNAAELYRRAELLAVAADDDFDDQLSTCGKYAWHLLGDPD
jgi:hypothetical protein